VHQCGEIVGPVDGFQRGSHGRNFLAQGHVGNNIAPLTMPKAMS
jgi:hypothetical protein